MRGLKAQKANKAEIDTAVKALLALKAEYKKVSLGIHSKAGFKLIANFPVNWRRLEASHRGTCQLTAYWGPIRC